MLAQFAEHRRFGAALAKPISFVAVVADSVRRHALTFQALWAVVTRCARVAIVPFEPCGTRVLYALSGPTGSLVALAIFACARYGAVDASQARRAVVAVGQGPARRQALALACPGARRTIVAGSVLRIAGALFGAVCPEEARLTVGAVIVIAGSKPFVACFAGATVRRGSGVACPMEARARCCAVDTIVFPGTHVAIVGWSENKVGFAATRRAVSFAVFARFNRTLAMVADALVAIANRANVTVAGAWRSDIFFANIVLVARFSNAVPIAFDSGVRGAVNASVGFVAL